MNNDVFTISSEVFNKLSGKSGLIYLQEIRGIINLNSVSSILPEELAEQNRKQNRDGQWCIKKYGQWYLENNQEVKVNLSYYPELEGIKNKTKEIPSSFAKQLTDKL